MVNGRMVDRKEMVGWKRKSLKVQFAFEVRCSSCIHLIVCDHFSLPHTPHNN